MQFTSTKNLKHFILNGLVLIAVIVSALGLTQPAQASPAFVLDNFSAIAYNNQNGPANWATDWIETNDDLSAATGDVIVTSAGELRLTHSATPVALESIERSVNMPINATAILTYAYRTTGLVNGDNLVAEIFNGATWATLDTYNGTNATGSQTHDITAYRSTNTRIRFRIVSGYTGTNKYFYADNVRISFWPASVHSTTSVLPFVQTYYLPLPEDQVLTALKAINADAVSPTTFYASITVIADNTVIYYDQWEDGFETAINYPTQNTSEIWGDNNPANGIPPGYTTDVLNAGDVITLTDSVNTSQLNTIDFDGGDKLAATEAIAVTRTAWASGSGTLHAGSVEVLDTSIWGTAFDVPVSSTVNNYDFTYNGLAVMASQNNTQISRNGTLVTTLSEGQSYLFNNNLILGDRITASAPIQATLLTGDVGSNYESDFFTLYPTNLLSSSYYAVVPGFTTSTDGGAVATAVYLYNPGASSITVHWTTITGNQANITVPARGAVRQTLPTTATSAHFYTTNSSVFSALSIVDSGSQRYDWGYTLIPNNQLTQQAKVGWGPGRDPTSALNPNENGSPVWFTVVNTTGATGNITVCVDYNGDNVGASTDSNGHHYDTSITAAPLSINKVKDPDGNQTGMLLYLCNGSESLITNKIAVAWGQDPATASTGEPGLDMGTSVPPLPNFTATKNAHLINDVNSNGTFDVGDTFEYQIRINNTGALPIPAGTITAADIVPQYTLYVPGSVKVYSSFTGATSPVPDNSVPPSASVFPLDEGGFLINEQLKIDQYFMVTFQVRINASLPGSTNIQNQANVSGISLQYTPNVSIIIQPTDETSRIGDRIWLDLNGNGVVDTGEPGLMGVTVELRDGTCMPGLTCLTDITDSNGTYGFPSLVNGAYTVVVQPGSLPGGLTPTGDPDSVKDGQTSLTLTNNNKPYLGADFGYQGNVSVGNFVWQDLDHDGVQDGGAEIGIDGVAINLTWAGLDGNLATSADNLTFSTTTAGNGAYNFTGLPAGTYNVTLVASTLPANYLLTTPNPLTLTNLAAATLYTSADFGAEPGATIGNYVWNDMNGDSIQNGTESGLSGVTVYIDSNGNGAFNTGEPNQPTDANGYYLFTGLSAGTYSMRVNAATVPAGYILTTANIPLSVPLAAWQNYTTADFGYRATALAISKISSAGGQVKPGDTITYTLNMLNNSGVQQTGIVINDTLPTGTTYVAGSTLANGYTPFYDNFDVSGYANQPVGSATWTGSWTEFNENDGSGGGDLMTRTGDGLCPNGGNCVRITGQHTPARSLYRQADLSSCTAATLSYAYRNVTTSTTGTIRVDIFANGVYRNLDTFNNLNDANGTKSYALNLSEITSGTRIYLSVGTTGNNSTNRVYFDNFELNCTIKKDNITGTPNPDLQNGVPPSLTLAGDHLGLDNNQSMTVTYQVTVGTPPYNPTTLTSIDNTASVTSIQQTTAQHAATSDKIQSITGDLVWNDLNGNGIQDSGEPGLSGVTVNLRDPASGVIVLTTSTVSGAYSFSTLPGSYILEFIAPAGYLSSPQDQGSDDAKDSDASVSTHRTSVIKLTAGQTNNIVDAGFYQPVTISDYVWNDANGDGLQSGESGLSGVRVFVDSNGNGACNTGEPSAVTNASGLYSISGLLAGTYPVRIDPSTLPTGFVSTYDLDGKATPNVASVTLTAGQVRTDLDFGYQQQNAVISDFAWYDANGNGIQDPGEPGISGATVRLRDSISNAVLQTTTTATDGTYSFSNLAAGAYIVEFVAPAADGGYFRSPKSQGSDTSKDSDADPVTGLTAVINLGAGAPNNAIDAGFYQAEWPALPGTYGTASTVLYPVTGNPAEGYVPHSVGSQAAIWLGAKVAPAAGPVSSFPTIPDPAADGVSLVNSTGWFEGTGGATIQVTFNSSINSSNSGYLVVWLDWNHDGDFTDPGEAAVSSSITSMEWTGSTYTRTFTFNVPSDGLSANLNYRARLFASTPSDPANAFSGQSFNGETEDYQAPVDTLPVTMNYFYARRQGNDLLVDWSTGTETGNLGFNLYRKTSQGLQKLNLMLIPSTVVTSHDRQDYSFKINFVAINGSTEFFLEDVDILGRTTLHGPFDLDKVIGQHVAGNLIDWQAIRTQNERLLAGISAGNSQSISAALRNRSLSARASGNVLPDSKPVVAPTLKSPATPIVKGSPTLKSPKRTSTPTATPTATFTPTPTQTSLPVNTDEPSLTPTLQPSATGTPEPVATETPAPLPTDTSVPSDTPTAEPSPIVSPAPSLKIADLQVNQTGIYRLTYEDLLASGLDLAGQPAADLAITANGQPVQIAVSGPDSFGPGSSIEFYGKALNTLYTDTNVYTLWADQSAALRVNVDQLAPDASMQAVPFYMETALVDINQTYTTIATSGDPWYNTRVLTYKTSKSWNFPIKVDHSQPSAAPASLMLDVWGGTSYTGSPDHHVVASFNSVQVASSFFDRLETSILQGDIPAGILKEGSNTLNFKLPGDTGQPADGIYIDRYSVTYPRSFWALNGTLKFSASGQVFQVDNLVDPSVVVYRLQGNTLTRLNGVVVTAQGSAYRARFNGSDQPATYIVSSASALLKPGIRSARPFINIKSGPADYLIISHPSFISGLEPLVQARSAQGLSVKVVDIFDIYDQFSYGVIDPLAIKNYIAYAANHLGTRYVLLVGDDTYDYKNYGKTGSISFIPSIYMPTGDLVQYAPVDPKYADINDDNVPELAIGRFAVRTPAELSNVITKTLAYAGKTYGKTSIFAADATYSAASDALLAEVPADWTNTTAYLDALPLDQARATLIASINGGTALTSYVGHTDDYEWTFNGLFLNDDAAALTNSGRPTVVIQNGCWNNYYVNPTYETMGDAMLNDGDYGAAAMVGSTTLTLDLDEQRLGSYFIPLLTRPGMTIGQAMLQAKQAMATSDPQAVDVLMGWTLLGDPYLGVTP